VHDVEVAACVVALSEQGGDRRRQRGITQPGVAVVELTVVAGRSSFGAILAGAGVYAALLALVTVLGG
jgi:hypothetical protein